MLEEGANKSAVPEPSAAPGQGKLELPKGGSIELYRELLLDVWLDGKVTVEEEQELSNFRELFRISQKDHELLQREIKIGAYLEALRIAWRDNLITDIEQKTLQGMCDKYGITPEETSRCPGSI